MKKRSNIAVLGFLNRVFLVLMFVLAQSLVGQWALAVGEGPINKAQVATVGSVACTSFGAKSTEDPTVNKVSGSVSGVNNSGYSGNLKKTLTSKVVGRSS